MSTFSKKLENQVSVLKVMFAPEKAYRLGIAEISLEFPERYAYINSQERPLHVYVALMLENTFRALCE